MTRHAHHSLSPRGHGWAALIVLAAATIGCQSQPGTDPSPVAFRTAVAGAEWTLRELGGKPAPLGAGGRSATLRFAADSARVTGFAGCNQYFGGYTVEGRTLRLNGLGMTRMFCDGAMTLEQEFAAALQATRSYEVNGSRLTLLGENAAVARFDRTP